MALWNRGYGSRGRMIVVVFLLICISISLLLVTVGGIWWPPIPHRGSSGIIRRTVNVTNLTVTPQVSGRGSGTTPTPPKPTAIATPNPCAITPTANQKPVSLNREDSNHPVTSKIIPKRPTPRATPKPESKATPSPVRTPIPTSTPAPKLSPSPVSTLTPTATVTPTSTATPEATDTPTSGITPTPSVTVTDTPTTGSMATDTPTATVSGSPNGASGGSHASGAFGGIPVSTSPGAPAPEGSGVNTANDSPNCGDLGTQSIASHIDVGLLTTLENSLWIILSGATLGTLLVCGIAYVMSRKRNCS